MDELETMALERWLATTGAPPLPDVWRATVAELDLLFETDLGARGWGPAPCRELVREAGRQLQQLGDGRRELIALLSPRRDGPDASAALVAALAEILWVPRTERTEYLVNPLGRPPWDIRRLLIEYAVWSRRIDALLSTLTKGFCAAHCERLPSGCCTIQGYDMGVVPDAMLAAQRLEARWRGWRPPGLRPQCEYHGPRGCCMRLFKSPACAGMLCQPLVDALARRWPRAALEALLEPLAIYRNHPLDRSAIFDAMRAVVEAGERLISS